MRCGEKVAATLDRFATVVPDETCGARLLDLAGLWAEIIAVIFSVAYLLTRCLMVSARLEGIQGPGPCEPDARPASRRITSRSCQG